MPKINSTVNSPSDKTIDEYIKTFPEDVQKILQKIRETIGDY
jgi:hypothetical protein